MKMNTDMTDVVATAVGSISFLCILVSFSPRNFVRIPVLTSVVTENNEKVLKQRRLQAFTHKKIWRTEPPKHLLVHPLTISPSIVSTLLLLTHTAVSCIKTL